MAIEASVNLKDPLEQVRYLDGITFLLEQGDVEKGITHLVTYLNNLKESIDRQSFESFVKNIAMRHPIRELIHQDPYAHRSFTKPRGYPGDAELLDFFYGYNGPASDTTALGREIFRVSMARPASETVRSRIRLLAKLIDDVAATNPRARILSIACGHLREAKLSKAVQAGRIGCLVGLDQDRESIELIHKERKDLPIEAEVCAMRSLLSRKGRYADFHFVYAAGLLDYFQTPFATRLTKTMFEMLSNGGRLLVANFLPETEEKGYMEAFMDWHLNYRTPEEVARFSEEIPPEEIRKQQMYKDPIGNVIYLEIFKK